MTSKTIILAKTDAELERFPEFPPRDDMQNPLHLYRPSYIYALELFLGNPDTTIVLAEVPLAWTPGQTTGVRRPDLLIADNINRAEIIEQRGYAIERQGKAPDFALEVASLTTGQTDYTAKRRDYEAYGVLEYWRFDPSGGIYHDAPLAGDRLAGESYEPIEIERTGERSYQGYSEFLRLRVCWEDGELRWFDPGTQSYIRTHADEVDRADNAERRADNAERRADNAKRRADSAEAENRRLRQRLRDLGALE